MAIDAITASRLADAAEKDNENKARELRIKCIDDIFQEIEKASRRADRFTSIKLTKYLIFGDIEKEFNKLKLLINFELLHRGFKIKFRRLNSEFKLATHLEISW